MPLTISFELSDRDLEFFSNRMAQAKAKMSAVGEAEVAHSAQRLLEEMKQAELPDFVRERVVILEQLVAILLDTGWKLSGEDRARIANAIAYVADPDDLIPDHIPGLGYIDDAMMIDMVAKELRHDLQAYEDFCKFREKEKERLGKLEDPFTQEKFIATRRAQLQERMNRRRASMRERNFWRH
jgi:uncharacterized membrane protein YkvA (DUF1232 family)